VPERALDAYVKCRENTGLQYMKRIAGILGIVSVVLGIYFHFSSARYKKILNTWDTALVEVVDKKAYYGKFDDTFTVWAKREHGPVIEIKDVGFANYLNLFETDEMTIYLNPEKNHEYMVSPEEKLDSSRAWRIISIGLIVLNGYFYWEAVRVKRREVANDGALK
jgi:hypothetical protein